MFWIPPFIQCIQQALDLHWALEASLQETLHRSTYLNTNPSNPLQYRRTFEQPCFFLGFYLFIPQFFASMQAISQFSKVSIYLSTPRNITLTVTLLLHLFSKSEFPPIVSWQKLKCISGQNRIPPNCILANIKMYHLARIEFPPIVSWQK